MSTRPLSILGRLAIAAVFWCALTLGVAAVVLTGLFREQLVRQAEIELDNHLVQLVNATEIAPDGRARLRGSLAEPRFERPFSGWAWQIRRGPEILLQSSSLGPAADAGALEAPPGAPAAFTGPLGDPLLGLSREIAPRRQTERLLFAVARPVAEIDAALSDFRATLLIALGALGVGQVAAVLILMRAGLRPLRRLRELVADMRQGRDRPPTDWPREIAPVAAELDQLAEHNARLVERARGRAADLAHAVKTPLSVIRQIGETLPPEDGAAMIGQADRIAASLDRQLARARAAGAGRSAVELASCVDDLSGALAAQMAARGVTLAISIPTGAAVRGDESDLYEMLGNLIENAVKWASSEIVVRAEEAGDRIVISVEDDGPGLSAEERAQVMARGVRLDEEVSGSGLGLSLCREIAELHGGELSLDRSDLGGLSARLNLPRA